MILDLDPAREPDAAGREAILQAAHTVAVLGAHDDPARPAHGVPVYLAGQGYRVFPVNATRAGQTILGEGSIAAVARLTAVAEPIDVVDVFRNSEAVAGHLEEILSLAPLPRVVWFQLGVRNDAVAERLRAEGIVVVQDQCMKAEHLRAGLAPK